MSAAEASRPYAINWTPVGRVTLARAMRHRARTRIWRIFCMAAAGVMGLAIVASGVSRTLALGFLSDAPPAAQTVRMINPRFTGRAGAQGSFVITAASAQRRAQSPSIVDLESPTYRTDLGLTVSAPKGAYDPDTHTIALSGGVVFEDRKGNRFTTPTSTLDAKTNIAHGPQPVQGAGPLGAVRADAYEIDATAGRVRMSGGVSGTLAGSK